MKRTGIKFVASALMALAFSAPALSQFPSPGGSPTIYGPNGGNVGNVLVYLRTEDGQPLPESAVPLIRISSTSGGATFNNVQSRSGDGWVISGLPINNEYAVHVSANGYISTSETVDLPDVQGATASVIVFLRPLDQELVFRRPTGSFVLVPKAAKEMQKAVQDLQAGKISSAQKHTQKAMDLAPANPYVQYVMGMTYVLSSQFSQAKPYLEKSVSIDPKESASLITLGTVRYRLGDAPGAIAVLSRAVQLDTTSWKAEWMLAASYLGEKEYADARDHAERALKIDKQKAGQVTLLLGQALAGLGEREGAAEAFENFASRYPADPNAAKAREWAKLMRQPPKPRVTPGESQVLPLIGPGASPMAMAVVPEPPVEVPPRPNWAPPDIDAATPFVIPGATCPLAHILTKAGENAEQLVTSLQEFSAAEDFQAIELGHGGELDKPSERRFNYMVFISQVTPEAFDVREVRDTGSVQAQLPERIADLGVPALAMAFHPVIQKDLDWKCEGLGTWSDQPAWVVRFEQDPKRPNVLASFHGPLHSYPLALKGRAWVSERSKQVLHLETDLVEEIKPIDLKREHFSIDYKPVSFREHNVQLWLPANVDAYIQYQGHFLHYYHHFSDFKLFWVGTTQKISAPKEQKEQEKEERQQ
jgi:tetratricopeptide (TPR) repeat protein